jgi:hypothetical protein
MFHLFPIGVVLSFPPSINSLLTARVTGWHWRDQVKISMTMKGWSKFRWHWIFPLSRGRSPLPTSLSLGIPACFVASNCLSGSFPHWLGFERGTSTFLWSVGAVAHPCMIVWFVNNNGRRSMLHDATMVLLSWIQCRFIQRGSVWILPTYYELQ